MKIASINPECAVETQRRGKRRRINQSFSLRTSFTRQVSSSFTPFSLFTLCELRALRVSTPEFRIKKSLVPGVGT